MYAFTKTNEEVFNTFSHTESVFDGTVLDRELTDSSGEFRTLKVNGRALSNYSLETLNTSGNHGGILGGRFLQPRIITITYRLRDKTNEGFRSRYERLNLLLAEVEKKLRFTDDRRHYFIATFSEGDVPEEDTNDVVSTLNFICHDPMKYTDPMYQQDVLEVKLNTLFPAHPVLSVSLIDTRKEFILSNTTTGKHIHLKSSNVFLLTAAIEIDTRNWTVTQAGQNRLTDLVITSDLEDFTVRKKDILSLNVPGTIDIALEGVAL